MVTTLQVVKGELEKESTKHGFKLSSMGSDKSLH